MTTTLTDIGHRVNLLTLSSITLTDLDNVDSWLFAIDLSPSDREEACRQVLTSGTYSVSNIEHRLTLLFKQRQ